MKISKRNLKILLENFLFENQEIVERLPLGLKYLEDLAKGKVSSIGAGTADIKSDNQGQAVRYVQVILKIVPNVDSSVANVGSGTVKGIKAFQKSKNIQQTGIIDQATAEEILKLPLSVEQTGGDSASRQSNDTVGSRAGASAARAFADAASSTSDDLIISDEIVKIVFGDAITSNDTAEMFASILQGDFTTGATTVKGDTIKNCAEWVNSFLRRVIKNYSSIPAAWLGYDPKNSGNYITNLSSPSNQDYDKVEKAFNLIIQEKSMLASGVGTLLEGVLDGMAMLPSSIEINPGCTVGLKWPGSAYLGQALYESSLGLAATGKDMSPGAGTRISSINFFKDEEGNYFSRKKDYTNKKLFIDRSRGLPGINSHIGLCVGSLNNFPIIAHNAGGNLYIELFDTMESMQTGCKIIWVNKNAQNLKVTGYEEPPTG